MSDPQTVQLDEQRKAAFAEKMLGVLNSGALGMMTAIGHRTGLFDVLADMPPATSHDIAVKAGLNERYVREWLGSMVTGRVVDYDAANRTYMLPREHAALLTRSAAPDNLASVAQWISVLGAVEDEIVSCFHAGGGVPYSAYKRFHEVMADESGQTVVAALDEHILPLVPGLIDRLREGIEVLDIGCGAGRALSRMAELFPHSRFTGYDISDEAISTAQSSVAERGLKNIRFDVKDISRLGHADSFHLVTAFDVIHDQAQPDRVLSEVAAAVRPDGTFLMQDISASSHVHQNMDHPVGPFLYTISCMHCMTVSLAQNGAGLGTVWGEEKALEMLEAAGFTRVEIKRLEHDFLNCYYVAQLA